MNPKHMILQDRPEKYGGEYTQEELDLIVKRAHKGGVVTMIYWGRGNKLNVRKEMKRINEMKNKKSLFSIVTDLFSISSKKSKKKGNTKTKKGKKNSSKRP
jgi:hypothetical protein